MRIGEFSNFFNVPQSTVRFYIKNSVLTPSQKNNQYVFLDTDIAEMQSILELKKMRFSLDEIKHYMQITRLYDMNDKATYDSIRRFLEAKRFNVECEIEDCQLALKEIDKKRQDIEKMKNEDFSKSSEALGVPLDYLEFAACPFCNHNLSFRNISIIGNRIITGELACECGFTASIERGVIVPAKASSYCEEYTMQETKFNKTHEEHSDFLYFNYLNELSPQLAAYISKSYTSINAEIEAAFASDRMTKAPLIFAPDMSCHYIYKYSSSEYLANACIVISCFSLKDAYSIKSHIESIAPDLKIIYVCNTISDLPLHRETIDFWIDANAAYNFSFFHSEPLHKLISPYLRKGAQIEGMTKYYTSGVKSLSNIRRLFPKASRNYSLKGVFNRILEENGYVINSSREIGELDSPGSYYDYHQPGDSHHFMTYSATKR